MCIRDSSCTQNAMVMFQSPVSAGLKMHQDRRLRSAPRGVGDGDEDTSAPAAVAISSPGFEIFPRARSHYKPTPSAPSAGAGVLEYRGCLESVLTDSMTR